mgnify:FL=1
MTIQRLRKALERRLQQFLLVRQLRIPFGIIRYVVFRHILRNLNVWTEEGQDHGKDVLNYNYKNISHSLIKHERLHHIIRPLVAIEDVNRRLPNLKTLSIGPRSEAELLLIAGYGFTWSNIRGLDLFKRSFLVLTVC